MNQDLSFPGLIFYVVLKSQQSKVVIALSLEEGMFIVQDCTKLWTVHICFGIDNHSLSRVSGWGVGSQLSVFAKQKILQISDLSN